MYICIITSISVISIIIIISSSSSMIISSSISSSISITMTVASIRFQGTTTCPVDLDPGDLVEVAIVVIFYPFSQFCEIGISLLSL